MLVSQRRGSGERFFWVSGRAGYDEPRMTSEALQDARTGVMVQLMKAEPQTIEGTTYQYRPTDLGLWLMGLQLLSAADLSLPALWDDVARTDFWARVGEWEYEMNTPEKLEQFVALAPTLGGAAAAARVRSGTFMGTSGTGVAPGFAASDGTGPVGVTSTTYPGDTTTPAPAAAPPPAAPSVTTLGQLQSAAQNFALAAMVNLAEIGRDVLGTGVLSTFQQVDFTRGLQAVSNWLADTAADLGVSLSSIPIPGGRGMTFGETFPSFAGGSFALSPGAAIQVNVDKFFGSDAEMRQLTDEIIRIARQEGLVLSPIV